jgi:hypothetical protein
MGEQLAAPALNQQNRSAANDRTQVPTEKDIESARTPSGGWTKAQLAEWGVAWPPPKGWKAALIRASGSGAA